MCIADGVVALRLARCFINNFPFIINLKIYCQINESVKRYGLPYCNLSLALCLANGYGC
jgi:hypothetical protein